jgi:2'-5' RNA ligase superfamily
MMDHPSYIVAEIPEPVRRQIQALRDSLNTLTARLPVEISLAGSSGVGPIPIGTDLSLIKRHLDRTLSSISPFCTRFSAIRTFPNTSIFYLEPFDRSPFDHIHQELRASGIPFSEIRWPYNPHCTLRGGAPLGAEAASELLSRSFPKEEFWINTVSVYDVDDIAVDCKLLFQRTLGA